MCATYCETCAARRSSASTSRTRSCSRCSTAGARSASCWPRRRCCSVHSGPARLARLVAECGDQGLLDGIAADAGPPQRARTAAARAGAPRADVRLGRRLVRARVRGLGPAVVLAPRGDRADSPVARRARDVLLPGRRAVRNAAGRRAPPAARRPGVHRRPVPARGAPRVGPRHGAGALRPAHRPGGPSSDDDLPVRVRRHERGVLRAPLAPHRGQRGRAAVRFRLRRGVRDRLRAVPARQRPGRSVPARVRRLRRRVLQREPVPRPRRLPDPQRLAGSAAAARARPGTAVGPAVGNARRKASARRCSGATRSPAWCGR